MGIVCFKHVKVIKGKERLWSCFKLKKKGEVMTEPKTVSCLGE